jgi:MFS transporter, MHS family, shikimate and dehydroshikimate transport protein
MTAANDAAADQRAMQKEVRRVVASSVIGTAIETYDFILYGSAAALIFGPLFFAGLSPALATIASFATLATGYLARPLGGLIFGYLGDRLGRRWVLMITVCLMGAGTGLIGLLPTQAQIGAAAPILLVALRIVQGIAHGGEWGGGVLMIAEYVEPRKRGLYTGIGQGGLSVGAVIATLIMAVVTTLPEDQLFSWGWRIPFIASFVLVALGIYLRLRIDESPLFVEVENHGDPRIGLSAMLGHLRPLGRGILASVPPTMSAAFFGTFAVGYAVQAGHARPTVLLALAASWVLSSFTIPLYGMLSDRLGRRPVYVASVLGVAILTYPFLLAMQGDSTVILFVAFIGLFSFVTPAAQGTVASLLSELFPTTLRSTGVSLSYQLAAVIAGFTPVVSASLLAASAGGLFWVVVVIAGLCVIAAPAVWFGRESAGSSLAAESAPAAEPAAVTDVASHPVARAES